LLHQSFLLNEQWWAEATSNVWDVKRHHADVLGFAARQWLAHYSSPPHKPPQLGSKRYPASADAPGSYVLEK